MLTRLPLICVQVEELEHKIETLQHERDELRSRITIALNNEGIDPQREV